jgi:hypothetical protein
VREANIARPAWKVFKAHWSLNGDLSGDDSKSFARELARVCLALCHAPAYQAEHKESLAQDWAHIPIPKSLLVFEALTKVGEQLGFLLNPVSSSTGPLKQVLGELVKSIGAVQKEGGGNVESGDLGVQYSFFGVAQGGWRSRAPLPDEPTLAEWGETTGDLYINDKVFFKNVPELVWRYELGGYPVIKKWLGYRDQGRRPGMNLSLAEVNHLRGMIQRIAAVLKCHAQLNSLYESAVQECFTAEELGLS